MHVVGWVAQAIAWGVAVATVAVLVTQAIGWCGARLVAVGQALTPLLGVASVLAAVAGAVWSALALTIVAVLAAAGTGVVVVPALRRAERATTDSPVGVFHANLLYKNIRHNKELADTVLSSDADVLALNELHPAHEEAMRAHPGAAAYPHRVRRPARTADGMAIWSRLPLGAVEWVPIGVRAALVAEVCLPDGAVLRVVLAHPNPPTTRRGLRHWAPSLAAIHDVAARHGPPTVIVGDLNATRWHPPFRRLLARGWRDAHEAAGRGLSVSWPATGRWPFAFVRLDHALLGDGVDLVSVRDLTVPGSDHRGFVVTLAAPRTGARASR